MVDLDPAEVIIANGAADPMGHYGGGDVLKLMINRKERNIVQQMSADDSGFEAIAFEQLTAD